jgi:hypothetical protein
MMDFREDVNESTVSTNYNICSPVEQSSYEGRPCNMKLLLNVPEWALRTRHQTITCIITSSYLS